MSRHGPRLALPLAALGTLVLAAGAPAGVLEVPLIPQRGAFWCWAASAEMVLDYLAPSQVYRDAVGQCTLARSLPEATCDCSPPDGFNVTDRRCDQRTPFGPGDFVPQLLDPVALTRQSSGNRVPIHRELLTCEIEDRRRPIVVWWRVRPASCKAAGHLVVASGVERNTPRGDLVLILDPWPVGAGDRYWLTWRGFACGFKLGGHCVDYYDVQGTAAPESCDAEPELDEFECGESAPEEFERVEGVPGAESAVASLLAGESGTTLRRGLDVPEGVVGVACNERVLIRGAEVAFAADGSVSVSRIGTTRLLCELRGADEPTPASIFLIDHETDDWLLAGFGASRTTAWLRENAERLVVDLDQEAEAAGEPPAGRIELLEVVIPGTGDLLLIRIGPGGRELAIHYQAPTELAARPLREVLQDRVGGTDSPTLEAWLRALPPGE